VKKSILLLVLLLVSFFCRAQRSEVGALVGASFYLGDLNNIPFRDAKFAGGLVYRYNFTPRVALKANILFGKLTASDENNHSLKRVKDNNGELLLDADGKQVYFWDYKERGLSFSSPVSEISAQLEVNFFNLYNVGHKNQISPYLFGGAAFFSFNPQAEYKGEIEEHKGKFYDLQPIGTEGQGRNGMAQKYKLTSFAIPFGIGFKANIGRYVCVGAEWGLRYTFTKYLDDVGGLYYEFSPTDMSAETYEIVKYFADPATTKHTYNSQRHSTVKNDWYSFAGVVVTIRIGNEDTICDIKTNVKLKQKRGRMIR
jgi:hypothetical protein